MMRLRTPARDRSPSAASGSESAADSSPTGGLARRLLVAAGVLALAYVAARILGSRDPIPAVDEIRGRAAEIVPDEVQSRAVDAVPDDRTETIRNRSGQTVPDDITEISIEKTKSEASEGESEIRDADPTGYPYSFEDINRAIEYGFETRDLFTDVFAAEETLVIYSGQGVHIYLLDDELEYGYDEKS